MLKSFLKKKGSLKCICVRLLEINVKIVPVGL